jgi:hypothetical protein
VGYALWRWARPRAGRGVGVIYPAWVAAEVIATGSHFLFDVVAGVGVAALGLVAARHITDAAKAAALTQDAPAS